VVHKLPSVASNNGPTACPFAKGIGSDETFFTEPDSELEKRSKVRALEDGPLFFGDKAIGLEHKIREEVPEVQGQKEVVGQMHRFKQYL